MWGERWGNEPGEDVLDAYQLYNNDDYDSDDQADNRQYGAKCMSCENVNFTGRRYKCLRCEYYNYCGKCYDRMNEQTVHKPPHQHHHPMQLVLTEAELKIYLGKPDGTEEPFESYVCPYCGEMGFSTTAIYAHVSKEHENNNMKVVCPICAFDMEPTDLIQNLAEHIDMEHIDHLLTRDPTGPPDPPSPSVPSVPSVHTIRLVRTNSQWHTEPIPMANSQPPVYRPVGGIGRGRVFPIYQPSVRTNFAPLPQPETDNTASGGQASVPNLAQTIRVNMARRDPVFENLTGESILDKLSRQCQLKIRNYEQRQIQLTVGGSDAGTVGASAFSDASSVSVNAFSDTESTKSNDTSVNDPESSVTMSIGPADDPDTSSESLAPPQSEIMAKMMSMGMKITTKAPAPITKMRPITKLENPMADLLADKRSLLGEHFRPKPPDEEELERIDMERVKRSLFAQDLMLSTLVTPRVAQGQQPKPNGGCDGEPNVGTAATSSLDDGQGSVMSGGGDADNTQQYGAADWLEMTGYDE